MASRPPPPPLSGDPFPPLPLPLSYRAALVAPLAGISPVAVLSPAAGAPPGLTAPAAALSLAAGAPPDLAAPAAALSPAIGAPPAAPLLRAPLAFTAPLVAPFPAVPGLAHPFAVAGTPLGHVFVFTATLPPTVEPPPPTPTQSATLTAAPGHDGSPSAPALSLPDVALLRSQLLAPGFPHVTTTGGAPVRGCPLPTTVYSQPSAIISSLRTPSDDAAAILAATRAAVTAARQRA
eukprot:XP_020406535.1 vegetative cell wall protein gp1-like [Zea mays]